MLTSQQRNKLHRLEYTLADIEQGLIAVSGGLDSRLLALVARRMELTVQCVHLAGPHMPRVETRQALAWLGNLGLPFSVLEVDPLVHPSVAENARDRCYYCKRLLFSALRETFALATLMDGSNATDQGGYRPGLRALAELGVLSPYIQCGISKEDIRAMALFMGLDNPAQPSRPCLLTRLPYFSPLRAEDLAFIDGQEDRCREAGFEDFRVRLLDGEPVLFAHEQHRGLAVPLGLMVFFTKNLSGYWDRQD
ncbi:MAG: ATP-dependent sacrificial sulfur transferase LarE [Proteobacteria bacterium]|nr:ATP-dependent sacrificial sulfur transferase LarE [Pseudomonadota bacterium]